MSTSMSMSMCICMIYDRIPCIQIEYRDSAKNEKKPDYNYCRPKAMTGSSPHHPLQLSKLKLKLSWKMIPVNGRHATDYAHTS
jgi:hypothetical protein